jgi:RluA family pseudouridine synthase
MNLYRKFSENILYEDNHLLVVNKPPGILIQGDISGDPDMLTLGKMYLKDKYGKPGNVFLGLVHRLDRPVSGIVVFARTSKAASRLSLQFRHKTPEKRYLAVVEGKLEGKGVYRDWIKKRNKIASAAEPEEAGAKAAGLSWKAVSANDESSVVEIKLESGRFHQIRFQFSKRGHPVLGDRKYGSGLPFNRGEIALHCYRLGIIHPVKNNKLNFLFPPSNWPEEQSEIAMSFVEEKNAEL